MQLILSACLALVWVLKTELKSSQMFFPQFVTLLFVVWGVVCVCVGGGGGGGDCMLLNEYSYVS